MWLTRIFSGVAGAWLPLAILFVIVAGLMAAYGVGRSHANTRWEARWEAFEAEARDKAAKASAAQNERWIASNAETQRDKAYIAARDAQFELVSNRLRDLAIRPRAGGPATGTCSAPELAAERDRADALSELLVESSALARELAAERDDAVARLWAAADAWPR